VYGSGDVHFEKSRPAAAAARRAVKWKGDGLSNTPWQVANRMDALEVRDLIGEGGTRGKTSCPFCGEAESLHAYDHGGFHCFGGCGGPSGQTYTNTEVVAKSREIPLREAQAMICELA
jgi:hypothetical protein